MVAFKEDWDVVAIDMRGYGSSDKPQVGRVLRGPWFRAWGKGFSGV